MKVNKAALRSIGTRNIHSLEFNLLMKEMERLRSDFKCLNQFATYHSATISISSRNNLRPIPISQIIRCASDGNYCHIFLADGNQLLTSKTLKFIQNKIDNSYFHRIHQSHLVNQNYIDRFLRKGKRTVCCKDGVELPVSRSFDFPFLIV